MHAVILAAGVGQRFKPEPLPHPKCLLEFGGKSLLRRSIENVVWAGCEQVTVVAGYRAEMIEREVERCKSLLPIQVLYNPKYECGSGGSLLCAAQVLENQPTLLLDSDYLYDRRILQTLVDAPSANAIGIDATLEKVQSEWWVVAQNSRITHIYQGTHKQHSAVGVYWSFHKFSPQVGKAFVKSVRDMFSANPITEYWHVMPQFVKEWQIDYLDVSGLPYCEMDTWADVEHARTTIYPQLAALGQG